MYLPQLICRTLYHAQVGDILRVLDAKKVWSLRNKYATLRPTGWRSDPGRVVPAKCVPPCIVSMDANR